VDDLKEKLERVVSDVEDREGVIKEKRKIGVMRINEFSWKRMAEATVKIYNSLNK
jgi:glycosyltransferase involved in cell wall biosynthesis